MSTPVRVTAFVVGLAVVFGAAFGVGRLFEDDSSTGSARPEMHLLSTASELAAGGARTPVKFQLLDADGTVLKRFATTHERDLHLVVVSHDLSRYQHLHPVMAADGTWSAEADTTSGVYRIFADFRPVGGAQQVVHHDVLVGGAGAYAELTAEGEQRESRTGHGIEGTVDGDLVAARPSTVTVDLKQVDLQPVTDLEPYLGAYGHLVVIGDERLDYVHAHAEPGPSGPRLTFEVRAPKAGQYHLFLDIKRAGTVQTLGFVLVAKGTGGADGAGGMDGMEGMDHGDH